MVLLVNTFESFVQRVSAAEKGQRVYRCTRKARLLDILQKEFLAACRVVGAGKPAEGEVIEPTFDASQQPPTVATGRLDKECDSRNSGQPNTLCSSSAAEIRCTKLLKGLTKKNIAKSAF